MIGNGDIRMRNRSDKTYLRKLRQNEKLCKSGMASNPGYLIKIILINMYIISYEPPGV